MTDTIVLAYSGGLDTSWCIPHLRETTGARVVTVTVDVGGLDGSGRQDLADRSAALGADEHVLVDARATFFDEVLRFLIAGNVLRGGVYPLCVGAERVLQAREVAREAKRREAKAICHGCTAAGNDQVRFEIALRTLAPELEILAPIRDLAPSRAREVADLNARSLPVPPSGAAYSINSGLWGVTIGGRETLDTVDSIPESAWQRTRGAFDHPRAVERHLLGFERGIPTSLDERPLDPVALIEAVDSLAAAFGVGRGIHLGETVLGVKGRVAFEAPAPTVLMTAHRELEKLVLTGRQMRVKETASQAYGDFVHEGQFLDPVCRDIEALLISSQERVTGVVAVEFRTGSILVTGVRSPFSLKAASRGVYGEAVGEWTPEDARGFSRLVGLPSVLHARAGRTSQ